MNHPRNNHRNADRRSTGGRTTLWQGTSVVLRAITEEDIPRFLSDGVVDDMRLYGDGYVPFPVTDDVRRELLLRSTRPPEGDECSLAIEAAGELVGSISTDSCDPRSGSLWYGVAIFREHRRRGYAIDAVTVLLRYFFQERRYHRAGARVYSFNEPSINLQARLGFREEGRLRDAVFTMGARFDVLLYGMTSAEFDERWGSR